MADHTDTDDAPPPPGPFLSTWGPADGPILEQDRPPALGVYDRLDAAAMPIGTAFPVGLVEHRRGPAKTFRLAIGKVELPAVWLCVGRRFVQLGDAAEQL